MNELGLFIDQRPWWSALILFLIWSSIIAIAGVKVKDKE